MKISTKLVSAAVLSSVLLAAPISVSFAASPSSTSSPVSTPGVNLRISLDQLLGEHAILLESRMKALYNGSTNQYDAFTSAMNQNTTELTQAITGIYGKAAGRKFEYLWNQHMYFFTYVGAVKAEGRAQKTLTKDKNTFSAFMSGADPMLSDHVLSSVLQDHINQITTAFDEYQAGGYQASAAEQVAAYDLMYTAGGYLAKGIVGQTPSEFKNTTTSSPAVNLEVALDQLLGEHAMVLELAMQALYQGNTGLYQAYMDQMTANTKALTAAIAGIYGSAAGSEFASLWNQHKYFFTYVEDVKAGNASGAAAAQATLTHYKDEFSQFLAKANPNFSESALSTLLQDHINQITLAFTDYVAGKDTASVAETVKADNLMYSAGAYLAQGIIAQYPAKFDHTTINTPAGNLRVSLDQLLGEHAFILEQRMQALGQGNAMLYKGYTIAMNQNTESLTQAITGLYGSAAGKKFEALWNDHMYFFSYVKARMQADAAQATLTRYKDEFSEFMATADPHLSEATLSSVLQEHINQITRAFNLYVDGRYLASDAELVDDYKLMYTAGDYLATGIEAQFPTMFANTSPNTAAGSLVATLDQLLGLHAMVLELRMQAQFSQHVKSTSALMDVMNQDTTELTAAIGSVYGAQAAQEFEALWNQHRYFFTYVTDVKDHNATQAAAAQTTLTKYKNEFAAFMASANPHFSQATLSTVLQDHINQITDAFNDYVHGDYQAAEQELLQAYNLMYTAGQYLATGIAAQFPTKFG